MRNKARMFALMVFLPFALAASVITHYARKIFHSIDIGGETR